MKKLILASVAVLAVAMATVAPSLACGGHDKDVKAPAPAPAPDGA